MTDLPRRRPWRLIAAGLVLAAIAFADTVVWAWADRRLSAEIRAALAVDGWTLDAHAERWGGWPLAAEIDFAGAVLRTGPGVAPPLAWTVPLLRARLDAWSPTRLVLIAEGGQTLALGLAPPISFRAHTLTASIDLRQRIPPRVDAERLTVDAPAGPVQVATAAVELPPERWTAMLTGLSLPGPGGSPVNPPVERLTLDGDVMPPVPARPTARESAAAWRASGGRVAMTLRELRWGALSATGAAQMTLSPSLQPAVAGQFAAIGLSAAVGQLASAGLLTPSAALAAQAMLIVLTAPTGDGAATLPFTLTDGVLTVARVPLLQIAPIAWEPD